MNRRSFLFTSTLAPAALALRGAEPDSEPKIERFEPVDPARDRVIPLKVYLPKTTSPAPVILFSHGLGGSRENNGYLGRHWAEAGFVAVFMQHAGSDEEVWKNAPEGERRAALLRAVSFASAVDRRLDVGVVLDRLTEWNSASDHPLRGRLDLDHIGMSGHSFGAVTTQAMMGQKLLLRSQAEPRLKAFLLMSPSAHRGGRPPETVFGDIAAPVLCMTGTNDDSGVEGPGFDPLSRQKVYAALPSGDKYQLVFDGGTHMAFGDRALRAGEKLDPAHHPAIQRLSTEFFRAYLLGDTKAKSWLESDSPKKDLPLKDKDRWEWK